MSSRNLRKVREGKDKSLPVPEDSDEDYQPLYAQNAAPRFTYEGLQLSSDSEEDPESPGSSTSEDGPAPEPATAKKNNKKKKKQVKKTQKHAASKDEEDEIDRSVKEINALLGAPPPAPSAAAAASPALVPDVMLVQQKHLNVANELKRKFGAESEEKNKRGNRQAQLRAQKKCIIVPLENTPAFQKFGLSMSVQRREAGFVYFTFDHSAEYRRRHQRMLFATAAGRLPENSLEEVQRHMHVEAILESADMMFRMEEYTAANTLIEICIAYMQFVAHPTFQLADPQTRLPYSVAENRTFHILVLKYLHLLTNRACHRTALELAKMLLNLDPTDPLAVLLVVDALALRAREHRWLIDAVDLWAKERDAGFLFNIQFSYAMAHFHVASKSGNVSAADELLQNAILRFPSVPLKLLQCASLSPSARVQASALFATADDKITKRLKELIFLYAKLTWAKWREPAVLEWLQRNLDRLAEQYDSDPAVQEQANALSNQQLNLFRSWPDEVVRHLCVIKPMSSLLVDGAVPQVTTLVASDPVPPAGGLNRYGYALTPPPVAPTPSAVRDLFSSLLPNFAPADMDYQYVMDLEGNNPALAMALAFAGQPADGAFDDDDFDINIGDGDPVNDLFAAAGALADAARAAVRPANPANPAHPANPARRRNPDP